MRSTEQEEEKSMRLRSALAVLGAAGVFAASPASAADDSRAMEQHMRLMAGGNPGMARMMELMEAGNPGMARMMQAPPLQMPPAHP